MAISKVIFNGVTQMDVTGDTVTTSTLVSPATATKNDGTQITGALEAKTSSDLEASGATVTVPAGVYSSQATKSVASGSATPASSISATGASVSTGTNTLTLSKSSVSNTPQVTAGYISSGTAGNSSVSLTASVTTKGATTYTPGTSDQTIASGTYLTGTQTISGDANLVAGNIKKDVTIFNTTGTYEGSGGGGGDAVTYYSGETPPSDNTGSDGDLYLQTDNGKTNYWQLIPNNLPNDGATRLGYYMSADTPNTTSARTAYIRCTPTVAAGVTIDWGDGSTTTTSSTSATNYSHEYTTLPSNGYYIQTITCTSGTVSFVGSSSYSIWGANSATAITTVNNGRVRWAVIGSSCTSIGTYAFCRGYALEEVKILSNNCTFGTYAFYYCYGLKRINIPTGTSVTSIPNYCFDYCYGLGELELPSNITTIGTYSFDYCYNLKLTIRGILSSIGTYAFRYCRSLLNITLSTNATLNQYALEYCAGLTTLTIPSTTTTMNAYCIAYLYSLQELHFKGTSPPAMSATTVWTSLPTSCKIYVPTGKLTAYTGASNYPSSSTYTYVEE